MAGEDKILKILLQIQTQQDDLNKLIGGLKDVKKGTDEAAQSGFGLKQAFEFAGANQLIDRLVETLKQVPEQFIEMIKGGVEFNAMIQNLTIGLAGVLAQTQPEKFANFEAAKAGALGYVDLLKAKANELGTAYTDMFESFEHVQAVLSQAGIKNVQEQIDLSVALNRALQAVGVSANVAARDVPDILAGMATRAVVGGGRMAALMGFQSREELDAFTNELRASGGLFDGFMSKLQGTQAASKALGETFNGEMNRMRNSVLDFKSEIATGMMEPLQQSAKDLEDLLRTDQIKASAREWGQILGGMTREVEQLGVAILKSDGQIHGLFGTMSVQQLQTGQPAPPSPGQQLFDQNLIDLQTEALMKQRDLMFTIVTTAKDAETQSAARVALDTLIASIQKQIADGVLKDAEAARTVLLILTDWQANFAGIVGTAKEAAAAIRGITVEQQKLINQEALTHQQAYGTPADIYNAQYGLVYNDILEKRKKIGLDISAEIINQLTYEKMRAPERAKELADAEKLAGIDHTLVDLKREESAILKDNRLQQELINQNPNLNPDQKQALLIPLLIQERAELLKNLEAWKAYLAAQKGTDPQTLSNIQLAIDKIRELGGQYQLLGFKVQQITSGVTGEIKKWADSFGTSAQQIGNLITGTINTALQSTNQLLLDAVFRTGDWRTTVVSLERSIANMFLTMLEKMALQQAMSLMGISTTTSAQVTSGAAITAAHAPAAAATSISSYGYAALIGEVLAITAIVAIMAALGGGFAGGGPTGGRKGQVAGIVHGEEYVFDADSTRSIGMENLAALHRAAPHFGSGGQVGLNIEDTPEAFGRWYPGGGIEPPWLPGNLVPSAGGGEPTNQVPATVPATRQIDTTQMYSGDFYVDAPRGFDPYGDPIQPPDVAANAGLLEPGNIDLLNRPMVTNPDGSISTVRSISINIDGNEVLIPTVAADGSRILTNEEALQQYLSSGQQLGIFDSVAAADSYAQNLHQQQAEALTGDWTPPSGDPTVQIDPGGGPSWMDYAPSLFPGVENPVVSQGGTDITNFGGNTSLGTDLSAPWETLDPGTGGPAWVDPTVQTNPIGDNIPGEFTLNQPPAPSGYIPPDPTIVSGDTSPGVSPIASSTPSGGGTIGGPGRNWNPDYGRMYGATPGSIEDLALMASMSGMNDRAHTMGVSDEGHTVFNPFGTNSYAQSAWARSQFAGQLAHPEISALRMPGAWPTIHGAGGGRIDGPPSTTDSLLAWLATGEYVIQSPAVERSKRVHGPNFLSSLNDMRVPIAQPHFDVGGRVGGGSSSAPAGASSMGNLKIVVIHDKKDLQAELMNDDAFRAIIIDTVKSARHEIGIGAVA
jgi:hypothetical protein